MCLPYPTMKPRGLAQRVAKNLVENILFLVCLADRNFRITHLGYMARVHKSLITMKGEVYFRGS